MFAQEQVNYTKVRGLLTTEAAAVADVYYDLDRYGANTSTALQASLRAYVHAVRGIEWTSLSEGRLHGEAWGLWDRVYRGVLDLEPQTPRETALRGNMLQDLDRISDSRSQREVAALGTVTWLFWVAALFGFALVVMPYFTFAPTPLHLMLLAVFAAFNGLVLFVIAAMANPYAEPAALEPAAFDRLVENWEAEAEQRANPE